MAIMKHQTQLEEEQKDRKKERERIDRGRTQANRSNYFDEPNGPNSDSTSVSQCSSITNLREMWSSFF